MSRARSRGRVPRSAKHIAETLTKVHALPAVEGRGRGDPSVPRWGSTPASTPVEGAIAWARKIAGDAVGHVPDLAAVLGVRASAGKTVVCHADLKGEHIFVSEDGTRVTALIDWADMTIADPAVDFAGLVIWSEDRRSRAPGDRRRTRARRIEGTLDRARRSLARAGLLTYCEAVLEGRERGIEDDHRAAARRRVQ